MPSNRHSQPQPVSQPQVPAAQTGAGRSPASPPRNQNHLGHLACQGHLRCLAGLPAHHRLRSHRFAGLEAAPVAGSARIHPGRPTRADTLTRMEAWLRDASPPTQAALQRVWTACDPRRPRRGRTLGRGSTPDGPCGPIPRPACRRRRAGFPPRRIGVPGRREEPRSARYGPPPRLSSPGSIRSTHGPTRPPFPTAEFPYASHR